MNDTSRRDLSLFLPMMLAAQVSAAEKDGNVLPSQCYLYGLLPVKKNAATGGETRQVFTGATHEGFPIDLDITTLLPGQMPHPAHTHVHEEMIMIHTGSLEVTIQQQPSTLGPGSVAYVKSNQLHGWKNIGDTPSTYFVLAIGHQTKA